MFSFYQIINIFNDVKFNQMKADRINTNIGILATLILCKIENYILKHISKVYLTKIYQNR